MKKIFLILIFNTYVFADCENYGPCLEINRSINESLFNYKESKNVHKLLESQENEFSAVINKYIGIPYQWGGNNLNGIDCSAFVRRVLIENKGIYLPRTSREQFRSPKLISIKEENLKPWDLLFFKKNPNQSITHVAIYIGNGKMLHSSKNEGGVYISEFNNSGLWQKLFFKAKRIMSNQEISYVENH